MYRGFSNQGKQQSYTINIPFTPRLAHPEKMGPALDVLAFPAHKHQKSDSSPTHHIYPSPHKHSAHRRRILERVSQVSESTFGRLLMRDTEQTT